LPGERLPSHQIAVRDSHARESQEGSLGNNKNPNQKQPGEKEPGTFHYNPGNMSGKSIGSGKDEVEHETDAKQDKKPAGK
jgi:hypothetical protein